jgi:hypothetical protein
MTHPRKTIRDNVVALLTGLTLTGSRVFASRVRALTDAELPALRVFTVDSQLSDLSLSGQGSAQLDLTIGIEIVVKVADDLDDTIDDIAEDVEDALGAAAASVFLGGYVSGLSTDIEFDEETNLPTGIARLAASVTTYV